MRAEDSSGRRRRRRRAGGGRRREDVLHGVDLVDGGGLLAAGQQRICGDRQRACERNEWRAPERRESSPVSSEDPEEDIAGGDEHDGEKRDGQRALRPPRCPLAYRTTCRRVMPAFISALTKR